MEPEQVLKMLKIKSREPGVIKLVEMYIESTWPKHIRPGETVITGTEEVVSDEQEYYES